MPSLTKEVPKNSPLHAKIVQRLSDRLKYSNQAQNDQTWMWDKADDTVLAYVPESDLDAKRRTARENNGDPKYTTIKLPYTFAVLMAAHTYLTSVFFARSPVHQFAGRHGEPEQQVQALEAMMGYQVEVGEMLGPYYLWLYDSLKYGIGIIEEYWDKEEIQFTQILEQPGPDGKPQKMQARVKAIGYEGNKITNISPRDFISDPRVPVGRFQEGEFAGARKRLSWETVVRRKAQGYYMNIDEIKGSGIKDFAGQSSGGSQLQRPEDSLTKFDSNYDEGHPPVVVVYEMCVSVIPSEWGVGDSDFPEKWMFTITGDLATLIGVQPHGAMHGRFPYGILESEVEAYGAYNRGLPEIMEGVQNTLDWLINQHFFNVRAALNNQFILDPSKIVTRGAEDGGPGFVYRLRPEAYGQDIRTFFHQIPVTDMTRGHIADMQTMIGVGERITGVNDSIMGVLNAGGRKTATEVRTSTGFGVNRLKTMTEYMSATGFSQHAQRLVQNSQQYFTAEKKFKIAGSLITDMGAASAQQFLDVKPESIQGFYDFVPVDGTLPVDRLALANLWKDILLQMRTVPGLILQYDLGKIFAHVAALAGVRNLGQFKLQIGSPAALSQQADAGNLVPVGGKSAPGGGTLPAGIPVAPTGSNVAPPTLQPPPNGGMNG